MNKRGVFVVAFVKVNSAWLAVIITKQNRKKTTATLIPLSARYKVL